MVAADHERQHRAFLAAIQLRHPWQFRNRGISERDEPVQINVAPGWHALLQRLFEEVEARVPEAERGGFRWRRVQSTGGVLELHFDGVRERVLSAVTRARDVAAVCCEQCGRSGWRRQVAGRYQVDCDRHFVERLLSASRGGDRAAVRWWHTPQPSLGERSPAEVVQTGPVPEVLIDQALRAAMPDPPRLNGAHRQRLEGVWPLMQAQFSERLRSLRLAEFEPGRRASGTLLALMAGEVASGEQANAVNALARRGFSDLRLRLLGAGDLERPARANDPWSCMLALEASVTIPRYRPTLPD
ncbi:MAG: DUF2384 domain-containing protein [Spiribacter sp.]|jgi:hypothetical protein|nr:DUF2384 domain-containing protein [Spiribacter sp.]MDR9480108.1 DUF2384 domain-containing protein [Spiribacter sp.]